MAGCGVLGMAFACSALYSFTPHSTSPVSRSHSPLFSRSPSLSVAYKGPETRDIPPWEEEMLEIFARSPLFNPEASRKRVERKSAHGHAGPDVDLDAALDSNSMYGIRSDIMEIFVLAARNKPGVRLTLGEPSRPEPASPRAAVKQVTSRVAERERIKVVRPRQEAVNGGNDSSSAQRSWESELHSIFQANPLTRK
ncbi:hypothetical protein GUITHDRAFT_100247 [Guillardia theta CCMP2712]|uniref:Uncharacterized protein n=1 Tax=Guillardia theta (strain CCMP2712) TaxID=905079 RepID=L1JZH9_GUITC|nr:hypothetical protein GUITHDRAFT_100247 [Guillardia theta CCMP2712]EKX53996.1 hypothetical protein GUITHDRAFT_100247 [Guillardia theta CCMP2712]|eukprot:XP_005840976.1 hypothetical protein GUITHDRAFT_100247 [Guillardia theta CCMP2712]